MSKKDNNVKDGRVKRQATFMEAIITVLVLVGLFVLGTILDVNYVPIMLFVATFTGFMGWRCGFPFSEMEESVGERIRRALPVMSLLLAIGTLIAGLMFSGTLPMLIYYGLQIVQPRWVVLFSFLLCAIFSVATGTSNGSASTAGLAMTGLAYTMPGVNLGMVAGACYAGAMFGDKVSPLSDTTVLAALVTENDIFDHIRHQFKTVGPAALISIIIYTVYGLMQPGTVIETNEASIQMLNTLDSMFKWNIILLIPIVIILWGALTKKPSNITILAAAISGIIIGVLYQGFSLADGIDALYGGFNAKFILAANPNFDIGGMSENISLLVNRGGITSMVKSFTVVFIAMYFAGIADLIGVLRVIVNRLFKLVNSVGSLILVSGLSCMFLSGIGSSTTIGIIIGGELFKDKYEEMGLDSLNLSRTLEDFGTGSTGFFPWTHSAMLYAAVLSSNSLTFLRYSYMSWIIWILALIYGFTGIGIKKLDPVNVHVK
ncbi:MAG: hypothetical protein KBG38_03470 [Candidatus Cloacimonas sp.]|nr:hypothetical protein [Candidatus Cloacimonas sp.]